MSQPNLSCCPLLYTFSVGGLVVQPPKEDQDRLGAGYVGGSVVQFILKSPRRKGTQGRPIDGADFYFFAGGASLVLPLCAAFSILHSFSQLHYFVLLVTGVNKSP
jgi:hypothetical protein